MRPFGEILEDHRRHARESVTSLSRLSSVAEYRFSPVTTPEPGTIHIDERFVGKRHPGIVEAAVANELLLFDPTGSLRILLNPTAALVWSCLDGCATLEDIGADLADGLDAPYDTVLESIVPVVAHFAARGIVLDARFDELPQHRPLGRSAPPPEAHGLSSAVDSPAVRVGQEIVRVHSNDGELQEHLRAAIAPCLTNSAPSHTLSLLAVAPRGRIAGAAYIYRDDELVFRTTSRGRALRVALAQLDCFTDSDASQVRLNAHVLVTAKGVVLVGGWLREMIDTSWERLATFGYRVAEVAFATAERTTFEVMVEPTGRPLAPSGVAAIDAAYPRKRHEPEVLGRFPIRAIVLVGSEPDREKLASPSQKLAGSLRLLAGLGRHIPSADAEWLSQLIDRVEPHWVFGFDDQELLRFLARLARPGKRTAEAQLR
jgi:hypothetical protein